MLALQPKHGATGHSQLGGDAVDVASLGFPLFQEFRLGDSVASASRSQGIGAGAAGDCRARLAQLKLVDLSIAAQKCGAVEAVLELPDIAFPGVIQQLIESGAREVNRGQAELLTCGLECISGQQRDVFGAFAERWDVCLDRRESVVQFSAKAVLVDGVFGIGAHG